MHFAHITVPPRFGDFSRLQKRTQTPSQRRDVFVTSSRRAFRQRPLRFTRVEHEYGLNVPFTNRHRRERPRRTIPSIRCKVRRQFWKKTQQENEQRLQTNSEILYGPIHDINHVTDFYYFFLIELILNVTLLYSRQRVRQRCVWCLGGSMVLWYFCHIARHPKAAR